MDFLASIPGFIRRFLLERVSNTKENIYLQFLNRHNVIAQVNRNGDEEQYVVALNSVVRSGVIEG
jgi:hypothetical protein